MNVKMLAFVICVGAIIYFLLYNLHDCTHNLVCYRGDFENLRVTILQSESCDYTKARGSRNEFTISTVKQSKPSKAVLHTSQLMNLQFVYLGVFFR